MGFMTVNLPDHLPYLKQLSFDFGTGVFTFKTGHSQITIQGVHQHEGLNHGSKKKRFPFVCFIAVSSHCRDCLMA